MSFLQWLVVDAIEAASDTVLALSAAGFVWTLTHGLRSVIVGTYLRSSSWISARRILGQTGPSALPCSPARNVVVGARLIRHLCPAPAGLFLYPRVRFKSFR
jgi:hypothetical protein